MRISTSWSQQLGVNAMLAQQTKLSKTQMQLSTGLKNLTPSDDPAAAARVLDLEKSIEKTTQYQSNINTARERLNIEESALDTAGNILVRAKELTLQAKNDTLNAGDRIAIKQEVDQMIDALVGVANTKNANGEFIFSGDLSSVPPFVLDAKTGEYVYQGGVKQRVLQIGPERQVADGDLGFRVFENISSTGIDSNEDGMRSVFNTLKSLSDALAGSGAGISEAVPAVMTGDRFLRYGADYSTASTEFQLTSDGGTVNITLNGSFSDLNSMVDAINTQITTASLDGQMEARSNGNRIEFVSKTQGSASSISITAVSGTFVQDAGFVDGQSQNGRDLPVDQGGAVLPINERYHQKVDNVLTDLDTAFESVLNARTSIGARLRALDDQESQNEKFILDTQTTLSETQDLDYAEAISRFNLQTVALQAAQQAFARVQNLSLFNYL
ncbi:MAG: flagellar hook-associated protein FlgL [Methylomicrobium sp.]